MNLRDHEQKRDGVWVIQPAERAQLVGSLDACMGPDSADRVVALVKDYLHACGEGRFWDTACLPASALAETARILGADESCAMIVHAVFELAKHTTDPVQFQQLVEKVQRDSEQPL